MEDLNKISAKALYASLKSTRSPYQKRAERAAELTVPYLMPKEGTTGSTDFVEPSQGLGARCLRHAASKLMNSLFPVNQPFFKNVVDDITLQKLSEAAGELDRGIVEEALSSRERAVMVEFNTSLFRPIAFEACRQLVLAGNYLVYVPTEGRPRGWRLDSYVVNRDGSGNILDIIIREEIALTALPEAIRSKVKSDEGASRDQTVEVYTKVTLQEDGDTYVVTQEVDEIEMEGDYGGEYTKDTLPFVALRFSYVEGEDYGRGMVDEYIGDLVSLEELTKALREGTIQGAKVVWMVSPNSTTKPHKLAAVKNGGFVQGNPEDVRALRLEKHADFSVAESYIQKLTERLSYAFMLNSAVQRQGERVTAEEIRYVAMELDQAMGGTYSLMSEEFQMPIAKLFQIRMEHSRKVPPLPKEISNTTIITGLEALGRGSDLNNLDALVAGAQQILGPEATAQYLNPGEYFKRRSAALGIDTKGLIRSDEEIAQAEQQQQMAMMAQHLGPAAIQQMGKAAENGAMPEEEPTGEDIDPES